MTKRSSLTLHTRTTTGALNVFTQHNTHIATGSSNTHCWRPPTDVTETDTHVVVTVEIAGMKDAQFHITLHGHQLAVSGIRKRQTGISAYYQMEISYGEFSTDVELPTLVKSGEELEASYADGFLIVRLQKQLRPMPTIETIHT